MNKAWEDFFRRVGELLFDFLTFKTFISRFWWAFFVLSVGSAVLYALVVEKVWIRFVNMRIQQVDWELAENIADYLEPELKAPISQKMLLEKVRLLSSFSPSFDIYLYDPENQSLLSASGWKKALIPLKRVKEFLEHPGNPIGPIVIDASAFEGGLWPHGRVFSAARVNFDEREAYLIVIIGGKRYREAGEMVRGRNLGLLGLTLFLSVVFITSILSLHVFLLLTRRFKAMITVVKAFQAGDFSRRIHDSGRDEMGVFAEAFNSMADTIGENVEALTRQDEVRRKLVADVSHELRRPLSRMSLSLETLREEGEGCSAEQRRDYIDQSIEACGNLSKMIADLFELSKLNASERAPNLEACEVGELVNDVVVKFQGLAQEKGIYLETNYPSKLPSAICDLGLIERALSNLIENAISYTGLGGTVRIDIREEGDSLKLRVKDNGPGIPPEEMPRVFDRFFRGKNLAAEMQTGGGLGLAIVKRIIELHGQKISLKSSSKSGTSIEFRLDITHE